MIDPGIWKDSSIGRISPHARLLYLATITLSDDYGRFTADSVELKVLVFGYDAFTFDQVEGWLSELIGVGLIMPYEANGRRYAVHPKWLIYQTMDYRAASQLPAPVGIDIDHDLIYGRPGRIRKTSTNSDTFRESPGNSGNFQESTLGEERRGEERTVQELPPTPQEVREMDKRETATANAKAMDRMRRESPRADVEVIKEPPDDFTPDPTYNANELYHLWRTLGLPLSHSVNPFEQEDALRRLHHNPPHWTAAQVREAVEKCSKDFHGAKLIPWAWTYGPVYLAKQTKPSEPQGIDKILNYRLEESNEDDGLDVLRALVDANLARQ
jgi:hypothetical protein